MEENRFGFLASKIEKASLFDQINGCSDIKPFGTHSREMLEPFNIFYDFFDFDRFDCSPFHRTANFDPENRECRTLCGFGTVKIK